MLVVFVLYEQQTLFSGCVFFYLSLPQMQQFRCVGQQTGVLLIWRTHAAQELTLWACHGVFNWAPAWDSSLHV